MPVRPLHAIIISDLGQRRRHHTRRVLPSPGYVSCTSRGCCKRMLQRFYSGLVLLGSVIACAPDPSFLKPVCLHAAKSWPNMMTTKPSRRLHSQQTRLMYADTSCILPVDYHQVVVHYQVVVLKLS
jgi:hypothetical protein